MGPPRPHLHRATVGFIGSGAGCGRSRSNPSREFDGPKWRVCCKIGALARSPHPLAPTHQPLQLCAAPQTHNQPRGTAALSTRRKRVAMHRGSAERAAVRASAQSYVLECGRVQAARRSTKTQAARTRCSQARCEGAGRTCKLQHARCSAAVPGSIQYTINARNGNHSGQQC
jgi:hypothetical protein